MDKYTQYKIAIMNTLADIENDDLLYIYNEYCLYMRYYDDIIMTRDELFEYIGNLCPEEAFELGYNSDDYALCDDYFIIDANKTLHSLYKPMDKIEYYLEEIACDILDNENSYGYDELEELIEGYWYNDLPDIN